MDFLSIKFLFYSKLDLDSENKLTLNDIRSLTILQELPFTVSFSERIQVLENSILNEPIYSRESQHQIRVRRDYLYEDAFDELSPENGIKFRNFFVLNILKLNKIFKSTKFQINSIGYSNDQSIWNGRSRNRWWWNL